MPEHRSPSRLVILTTLIFAISVIPAIADFVGDRTLIGAIARAISTPNIGLFDSEMSTSAPVDESRVSQPQANGRIFFASTRVNSRYKIFSIMEDGRGLTCVGMCSGVSDPAGVGSTDPSTGRKPAVSADGTKVAFVTDGVIWTMNSDGSGQFNTNAAGDNPQWSPDGEYIVFHRNVATGPPANFEIFIMKADGTDAFNMTNRDGNDTEPSWGAASESYPKGRIAWASDRAGTNDIFVNFPHAPVASVKDSFPTAPTVNASNSHSSRDDQPRWAPDGTKLLINSDRDDFSGEIYTMTIDSGFGSLTRHTSDPKSDGHAVWSPDGTKIAWSRYMGNDGQNYEIFVLDPSRPVTTAEPDPNPYNLTKNPADDRWPSWGAEAAAPAQADMQITSINDTPDPAVIGDRIFYTINLVNNGPAAASGVKVVFGAVPPPEGGSDPVPLPTTVSFSNQSDSFCSMSERIVTCNIAGTIASGGTSKAIVALLPNQNNIVLDLKAKVTANEPDPSAANNVATVQTTVNDTTADLSVTITPSTQTPSVDREISYVVTIKNNGPKPAQGTELEIELPPLGNFKLLADVPLCGRVYNASGKATRLIRCSIGVFPSNNEASFTVRLLPRAVGTMPFRADIESTTVDPKDDNNTAKAPLEVSDVPRPSNDNLSNAQLITSNLTSVNGTNVNATVELANSLIDPAGELYHARQRAHKSVWYSWVSPLKRGEVVISTSGSGFDTLLDVYKASPMALIPIIHDDDSGGNRTSKVKFRYEPETLYIFAVDGFGGQSGDITVSVGVIYFQDPGEYRVIRKITSFSPGATCSESSDPTDILCNQSRDAAGYLYMTIRGEHFTPQSKVEIDGGPLIGSDRNGVSVPVTTEFKSSTELEVKIPPNPPLLYQRVAAADVVTPVTLNTGNKSTGINEIFKEKASNTAQLKVLDLKEAVIQPGETVTVCGDSHFKEGKPRVCMSFVNFGPGTTTVQPGWFSAVDYCNDKLDGPELLTCASDVSQKGLNSAFAINPKGLKLPDKLTFGSKISQPPGVAPPKGVVAMSGGVPSLIGTDGATLIGTDGGSLIGTDGATLIGTDGASVIGTDGASVISTDGASLISESGSTLLANQGHLIGTDGSTITQILIGSRYRLKSGLGISEDTPSRPPSPIGPGDLINVTSGYVMATGSGGSQPTVTMEYDEVTDESYANIELTLDNTSSPRISNTADMVFTVLSDPAIVKLSSNDRSVSEGAGSVKLTVERTGDLTVWSWADFTIMGSDSNAACSEGQSEASERCDFSLTMGTIAFAPNETEKDIVIPVVDDEYSEAAETFKVIIGNAYGAVLQLPSAATVTITDNDTGNAPTAGNPLDGADAQFFVRQQYLDLLGREPSETELSTGAASITGCGNDENCRKSKRTDLSYTLFLKGQEAAGYVFRLYRAAFGNTQPVPIPDNSDPTVAKKWPGFSVISRDRALVSDIGILANSQLDLANAFVLRPAFTKKYSPVTLADGAQFVDAVLATIKTDTGADLTSQRTKLIDFFDQAGAPMRGRGAVMHALAQATEGNSIDNAAFINAEDNRAFASMLYFGYLRRDGNVANLDSLVTQIGSSSDRKGFIDQFISSAEYRQRFGPSAVPPLTLTAQGRVMTSNNRGLSGAEVSIVDPDGVVRSTLTSSAGYFSFADLPSGRSYTVQISSKRYRFTPRTMTLSDNITFEDFVGVE